MLPTFAYGSAEMAGHHVEKPLFMIGLTSSCLRSVCSCAFFKSKNCFFTCIYTAYEYFSKSTKGASSSQWFLCPVIQGASDPTITHIFTYRLVCQTRIHMGDHIPVIFCPCILLSSNMGLSNVNQHFSSKSRSECLSVCHV